MKNFVKIFMTVVAGMMAFSCATDTTDDLTASVGKGQKTVISASLEESRTQLGGYDKANKKYPMYWSAGDKISANGIVSEPAVINTGNAAVASFAVNGLGEPDHYFVAYPAVANAEGDWQVKFAAEQKWTFEKNTTFDEGVSTMYGYSEEGLNVQMNHLTGILKIGIVGSEEVTLTHAQISTVDRKPIAGTFDFAFEKDAKGNDLLDEEGNRVPKLTPTADAKSVINYSFEGDESDDIGGLSSTPTYIYVAVPAGIYDELYVTLYDTKGGIMYATVKAGESKPLVAGTVREFKKDEVEQLIEYTPADVYIVKDAGTLAGVKDNLTKKVVMVADVDMTNETWTSIENFAGEFYGNGYAIKGLKAPLFGTTYASVIKGVHLEGVNIDGKLTDYCKGNSYDCFGALACVLGNTAIIIENNSVSGNIKLDVTGHTKAARIAGVIGAAQTSDTSSPISKLVNRADITISGTTSVNESTSFDIVACGVIARCSTKCSISDCQNLGSITSTVSITNGTHYIGGVGGALFKDMSNCTNGSSENPSLGAVKFNGTSVSTVHVYGLGVTMTNATNCNNYASVELAGTLKGTTDKLQYGATGLFATLHNVSGDVKNCNNYGPITVSADMSDATKGTVYLSGVGNQAGASVDSIVNCTNEGTLTFNSKESISRGALIGGIVQAGDSTCRRENLTNKGDINISASTTGSITVGGVLGRIGSNGLSGTITNEGKITMSGSYGNLYVGGLCGRANDPDAVFTSATFVNKKRSGEEDEPSIVFSGTVSSAAHIGGIIGQNIEPGSPISATNTGDIECTGTFTDISNVFVGGIYGSMTKQIANANCYCKVKATNATNVGMLTGSAYSDTIAATNCKVGGWIWVYNDEPDDAYIYLPISNSNLSDYIYGSGNSAVNANGCTYWDGTEE